MALTAQDIARIAHLARLQLSADEGERMQTQINGFFEIVEKGGPLPRAGAAAARIANGDAAPLLGVPIAHKDIFVTKDFASTAGSRMLEGYRSPFDATVVAKLADAGCVTLGKLNCDEFAM